MKDKDDNFSKFYAAFYLWIENYKDLFMFVISDDIAKFR